MFTLYVCAYYLIKSVFLLNIFSSFFSLIISSVVQVTLLFQGHEDLLAEFVSFLPNNSGSDSAQYPLSARNALPAMHPMHFDKVSSFSFFL